MEKEPPQRLISDVLRQAIAEDGRSITKIAQESGVPQPMLSNFMKGKGINLSTADKLADFFQLELRETRPIVQHLSRKQQTKNRVQAVLKENTIPQAAQILGVSTRTIYRYK
jgi:predicted transcriptional regulator